MNFRKFSLKHITLLSIAPALVVWGILSIITYSDPVKAGYNGLIALAVMFLVSFGLKKYHSGFMKKAERSLYDDCDPYPTLDEIKLYLECAGKRVNKTGLTVTLAMMQSLAGQYEEAENTLKSFDIGENSTLPAAIKAGILYDYAALYCAMNLREHAIDYYDRAKEALDEAPEHMREKINFEGAMDAEIECYKGNTDKAIDIIDGIEPTNKFGEVTKAFSLAKILYIAGEKEDAITEFDWVAENGGRLACAAEAAEISAAAKNME